MSIILLLPCMLMECLWGTPCEDLSQAVDLEVIKTKTNVATESSKTRDGFQASLLERDACCIWTGAPPEDGEGLHIIPFKRGDMVCSTILHQEDI